MRIILFTGKGGVGKTSVAAATALAAAERGYRTVILSTDAAHSLADSFDTQLGEEPVPVAPNLWGQETDIYYNIRRHWGTIQSWITAVLAWRGFNEVLSEEIAVLPGMEELANLLWINEHYASGRYDTIVVDCAPTGETLRLLTFPEVARWWLEKILPLQRRVARLANPMLQPFLDVPLPDEPVFQAAEDLFKRLDALHRLMAGPESSVRLVLNPEKMVIKEAQRTLTYLNLYGYGTDAVICNRLLPGDVRDGYFDAWKESQVKYRQLVDECFSPIPILPVPLFEQEVVGLDMLRRMGEALFGNRDPTGRYYEGHAHTISREPDHFRLTVPLPFASKEQISVTRSGDELILHVGNQRRNIILPRALAGLDIAGARYEREALNVRFVVPASGVGERRGSPKARREAGAVQSK